MGFEITIAKKLVVFYSYTCLMYFWYWYNHKHNTLSTVLVYDDEGPAWFPPALAHSTT